MEPMTVKAEVVRFTESNFWLKLNNHTVKMPSFMILMVSGDNVTFRHRKDAMNFYKMTA